MRIVAIDCGIRNMALVSCSVDSMFEVTSIDEISRVDITKFDHTSVSFRDCKLQHTSEMCDRIDHFVQAFANVLRDADVVLIERQPIGGLTSVHDLLFSALRDRAVMISPNGMHKGLSMTGLTYEERKDRVVDIAAGYVKRLARDPESFFRLERKHDAADALCMILYYCQPLREKAKREARLASLRMNELDAFRFRNLKTRWTPNGLR